MNSVIEKEYLKKHVENKIKKDRLDIRLPKIQKELIEHVAGMQGRTLTDFILKAAIDAATQEVERSQIILLSMENQRRFIEAIENPREPSDAVKIRYKQYVELKEKLNVRSRRETV